MSQTLTQINTALTGTAGVNNNPVAGGNGVAGGDADETFSNDSFPNNGNSEIDFDPQATGGTGTAGVNGNNGAAGTTSTVGQATVYGPGGNGQSGGDGADDGSASIGLVDISAGSSTTAAPDGVQIDAVADGGNYGGFNEGGFAGGGGTGGYDATNVIGNQGGNGGNGGSGGLGGNATVTVSGFVSYDNSNLTNQLGTDLFTSLTGGTGGVGAPASAGAGGASPSNGGTGGDGGDGGSVTDTFSGSTVIDENAIFLSATATGGMGEIGGEGGQAGYSELITNGSFQTEVYGVNGDGGGGGGGGSATITLSSDTLTAPNITMNVTVSAGAGNAGGSSPSEASVSNTFMDVTGSPSGAAGAAGAEGVAGLVFTGNTITVGQGINGSVLLNKPGNLALDFAVINRGTVTNTTQNLNGGAGGNLVFSGNDFVGSGTSTLNLGLAGTGSVTIDTGADTISIAGSPNNTITGFSTLDLDTNNTVIAGAGPLTLNFASDPDTLIFTPTSGTVTVNLATTANMVLEFQGFGSSLTPATLLADTTSDSSNTYIKIGSGEIQLTGFTATIPTADETIVCYRGGTRIATPDGAVAVEDLTVGDLVLTHDGEALAVRWIGRRHLDCRGHAAPETVFPVRIAAHAFGENLPRRDLFLSPDHAVYAESVLIPVKYLIDGVSVVQVRTDDVTYYHVELDRHVVMLAEGLPAESYLDVGDRMFFSGDSQIISHPSMSRPAPDVAMIREANCAAPLCVTGPVLERVRNILASRANGGVVNLAA